jgi:predicted amidohydrolase
MTIRIAQVKVYPVKGELEENHQALMDVLEEIAPHQPDVVITPEGFLDGYVSTEEWVTRDNILDYAIDPETSPYAQSVASWAGRNGAWAVLGCTRRAPEGAYNTALIYDRAGTLVGWYDKTHIQTHDYKYVPGQALPVFDSDFGVFGAMICADRRWPETVRTLALKGARVILNPTYGMHDERNLHVMQTRSYESEVFIAFTHPGQALITGPRGEVVCNEEREDVRFVVTEMDLDEVDRVRGGPSAHLRDRRVDLYER